MAHEDVKSVKCLIPLVRSSPGGRREGKGGSRRVFGVFWTKLDEGGPMEDLWGTPAAGRGAIYRAGPWFAHEREARIVLRPEPAVNYTHSLIHLHTKREQDKHLTERLIFRVCYMSVLHPNHSLVFDLIQSQQEPPSNFISRGFSSALLPL